METIQKAKSNKITDIKILGFPILFFLIMLGLMLWLSVKEALPTTMIGGFGFAVVVGTVGNWIGDRIPIWKDWLGGGTVLCLFIGSLLTTFNALPASLVETVNGTFITDIGFLDFFIMILICGAILDVDRNMLIKSFGGFIPAILGGCVVSAVLTGLAALIVGQDPFLGITDVCLPIMGGGTGAGVIPMSQMWEAATGRPGDEWLSYTIAVVNVGNIISVVIAACLDKLGKAFPALSGEGLMMKSQKAAMEAEAAKNAAEADEAKEKKNISAVDLISGFALALVLYNFAGFWASDLSFVNRAGLGFSIHKFAFMVIFTAILNIANVVPANVRAGAKAVQSFFGEYLTGPLILCIGLGINLTQFAEAFRPDNLFIITMCCIGSVIGAGGVGALFGFYFVEAGITAGLDMAGNGGSGDLQILSAAHRMHLISYAQISSRIGGAFMLVVASIVFAFL